MRPHFPDQIDNTMRTAWAECERKWSTRFLHHWASAVTNVHLHAGAAFASGMEAARLAYFLEGKSSEDAIAAGWVKVIEEYGDFQPPPASKKTAHNMGGALISYFDEYPLDTDPIRPVITRGGKPAVEFNFAIPLPIKHPETGDPILYCGRFDLLGEVNNQIYVVDEKTTQSGIGEYWLNRYALSSQFTGYCWAANAFGYPAVGAIVRGIGINKDSYKHAAIPLMRPAFLIEEWYNQLLVDVQGMIASWEAQRFSADYASACGAYGGCQYLSACQIDPSRRDAFLSVNFVKNPWIPLKGEEHD